jgi:hypothetical protein
MLKIRKIFEEEMNLGLEELNQGSKRKSCLQSMKMITMHFSLYKINISTNKL